jgi:hypothetical protein
MSNLEFTAHAHWPCDTCGRPTKVGFYHLHNGTPVLFDCVPCAERLVGTEAVQAAVDEHRSHAFRWMEVQQAG